MRSLVISGGGSKGAFAVGAIARFWEAGIRWDAIFGTSTGALIAPMVGLGLIDELEHLYSTVTTDDIIRKRSVAELLTHASFYDSDLLWRLITQTITPARYAQLTQSTIDVYLSTVHMQSGKVVYWHQHTNGPLDGPTTQAGTPLDYLAFVRAMLASASPPLLFPLVEIYDDHQQYCDGGVHEIAPLQLPINLGAETIDAVVLLAPDEPPAQPGVFLEAVPILERTLDMVLDAATVTDIKLAQVINAAVADRGHVPSPLDHYRLVNLHVIQPEHVLPAAAFTFDPSVMQQMIALGRDAADRALQTW